MKIVFIVFIIFIHSLYAKEIILYPVYNIKLDKVNKVYMDLIIVKEKKLPIAKGWPPIKKTFFVMNLNNLLLLQNDSLTTDFVYFTLGKIIIDGNNKLSYKNFNTNDIYVKRNSWHINNKILEIKKNIAYLNNGNYTINEIKKNLDVDLINEELGSKLYKIKQTRLSTKEATNNFINSRFCEQMLNMYSTIHGCYIYSVCNDIDTASILIKNRYINRDNIGNNKTFIQFYEEIIKKGNIYKQLDKKNISKPLKESI